jgi:hypothetical protein
MTKTSEASEVEKVIGACEARLAAPEEWKPFPGYPDSLALSVLDSIWSINARYAITRGVIERYRARRRWQGNPEMDGLPELLAFYEAVGGVERFIDGVGTRNRVSTQPDATRKGEAVHRAALALHDLGIDTTQQFRDADGSALADQAKQAWLAVPGQGSGVSWRYLRMLVGLPDVKPDRMILRFIASAIGVQESEVHGEQAVALVEAAAQHFDVDPRALDHEIWECQSGKRDGHDPISERELIGELAHSFIGSAFPSLTWDNIIPPPTHHPFIDVGRDYAGSDVSGPEFAALEEALNASYPNRFSEPLTKPHPEFSNMYIFSFLEGCVVRCADAGDNIFEGETQPVQVSVDELLGVLDASEYTMTCCRAASQVTPATGTPVTIGDVTLYPDSGASDDLLQRAVDLIPAGPSALNREIPRFYDPPSSLIVTSTTTDDGDIYGVARTLAGRIDRFLLLARLLFAGTHQSCWQLIGASTLISRVSPMYRRFEKAAIPDIRMQRVVRLQESDAPAFAALGALLDDAVIKREGMVATSFDIALLNYNRSHEEGDDFERVIDLATALEAILTGSESDTEAVGHRLRTRASALLWTDDDPGLAIYRDVSALYGLRSRLVHGERIKESDLRKWIYSVSTVADDAPFGVAVAFAVDRLRDLVRRSFLARLCLASGVEPLWPFEGSTAVDAALADNEKRRQWREMWRSGLASITRLDRAVDAAPPGADPLRAHAEQREA